MNKHEQYFRDLTQDYVDFEFNGNDEAYESYLQEVLPDSLKEMERFENEGNEFWLKTGKERAFGQLQTDILLMNPETFYQEVCELLGRTVDMSEFEDREKLLSKAKTIELERQNPFLKHKNI